MTSQDQELVCEEDQYGLLGQPGEWLCRTKFDI
jgi:hypothetical protein